MGSAPPKRIGQQQIAVVAWNPSNSKGLEGGLAAHKGEADTSIEFVRAVREILVDLKDLEVGSEDRGVPTAVGIEFLGEARLGSIDQEGRPW